MYETGQRRFQVDREAEYWSSREPDRACIPPVAVSIAGGRAALEVRWQRAVLERVDGPAVRPHRHAQRLRLTPQLACLTTIALCAVLCSPAQAKIQLHANIWACSGDRMQSRHRRTHDQKVWERRAGGGHLHAQPAGSRRALQTLQPSDQRCACVSGERETR